MQKIFKNKKKSAGGFTIIETLFGVSIFVLVMLALTFFSRNIWSYNSFISAGLTDADTGRQTIKTMTSEIRTASAANTGAYVISLANVDAFTFYSDIDDDGLKEKVRYFLNGPLLQKGVIKPTGNPLTYSGTETILTLVSNVTNSSIFEYYNKDYAGTEAPLSFPVNIPSIRLIKITITTDKDANRPPAPMTFSTQVSIRNLKDNL